MDALDQALPMLEAIKAELEFNPRLLIDFPEATGYVVYGKSVSSLPGTILRLKSLALVKNTGSPSSYRPDLVIGDDLRMMKMYASEQRDKLMTWVLKACCHSVMPMTVWTCSSSVLFHYDSVLSRLINNKLWRGKKFRAVEQWPENMAIWDTWTEILLNDGEQEALDFYQLIQAWTKVPRFVGWVPAQADDQTGAGW
jgi:hypothetical protein